MHIWVTSLSSMKGGHVCFGKFPPTSIINTNEVAAWEYAK